MLPMEQVTGTIVQVISRKACYPYAEKDTQEGFMRIVKSGRLLFAVSLAGLGVLSLLSHDFAMNWQPVPAWVPWRDALAYFSGAVLLVFGLGLLSEKFAAVSAVVLTADFLLWLVLLHLAQLKGWRDMGGWLGAGECAILVCGAWGLLWLLPVPMRPLRAALLASSTRLAVQILFAIGVMLIGAAHFVYAKETAALVPSYLPARLGFAYFTGVAHIATGVAIAFGILPRLASTLEGAMMTAFGLMVWAPRVVAAPTTRFTWTAMLISFAYGAGCLIVSGLFKGVQAPRVFSGASDGERLRTQSESSR
jgi:uncharacterized membrane protein